MKFGRLLWIALLLAAPRVAGAAEFYVSPGASASGNGSIGNPWRLQTALNQPAAVHAGDVIWLRGGIYAGTFTSQLNGTSASPIVVRQYPGERATIDGGNSNGLAIVAVRGSYTWFWGFEIMSSNTKRVTTAGGPWPSGADIPRGEGVLIDQGSAHPGLKFINMVVHDTRQGFSFWDEATDSEIYGSIVYYNGWEGSDDGHGHGIYAQNQSTTKRITDNILFQQFGHGIQAYGSSAAFLDFFRLEGNTVFLNGDISPFGSQRNMLVGGGDPAQNPTLIDNAFYYRPGGPTSAFRLGYESACVAPTVTGNYVANNTLFNCSSMTISGNTFYGTVEGFSPSQFPNNSYFSNRPTGAKVFLRPNDYESGRANLTIFNWDLSSTVSVNLSSVLAPGAFFEIRNAQNFFGPPVLSGVYAGGSVTVPLVNLPSAAPVGYATPAATGPEFHAFVVLGAPSPFTFFDVLPSNPFFADVTTLAINGITAGCGGGNFCPSDKVQRDQMAVFLLKTEHGGLYVPPSATGTVFNDVPSSAFAAAWIEQLSDEDVTTGCGGGRYCPGSNVSRAQMAVFLLRTLLGPSYTPPPATGTVFSDVPASSFGAAWIEELSDRGITSGCGGGKFCPSTAVTRGQMATLLVKTFNLN